MINQFIKGVGYYLVPQIPLKKKEVAPELQIVNGGIFGHCAAYTKEDYIDLDSKHEEEERFKDEIKFDDDLCDNAETSYTGKFKLKCNHS